MQDVEFFYEQVVDQYLPEFRREIAEMWMDKVITTKEEEEEEYRQFYEKAKREAQRRYDDQEYEANFKLTKEQRADIKKKAAQQQIFGFDLLQQYLKLHNQFSYYNELIGEATFRVLLSALLKGKSVYKSNGKKLDFTLHNFTVQNSGTGKDQSLDLFQEVVETINYLYGDQLLRLCVLSGAETPESLLDHFATKKEGGKVVNDYENTTDGTFSSNDIIISRECSFLFVEHRGERQTKAELFLQALEGRPIRKSLRGWDGHFTITESEFCFIGMSRPISNMKSHIATSGLQQRAINIMRDIDIELRKKMSAKDAELSFGNQKDFGEYTKQKKEFAKNMLELIKAAKQATFEQDNPKELAAIINDNVLDLYKTTEDLFYSKEHKIIAESFIGRFNNIILILAYQNALLREYKQAGTRLNVITVNKTDVQLSVDFIMRTFNNMMEWIEETLEEDNTAAFKRRNLIAAIKTAFSKDKVAYIRKDLAEYIAPIIGKSINYCLKIVTQNTGEGKILAKNSSGLFELSNSFRKS